MRRDPTMRTRRSGNDEALRHRCGLYGELVKRPDNQSTTIQREP
jgi:hypothetical protein